MQKPFFIRNALFLAVGLALSACGTKQSENEEARKSVPFVGTKLAEKQEVVLGNGSEPESLDPQKVSGVPEANIIRQMFVGLTSTDNNGKTVGGMAETWSNKDFKVWTFNLRDAQWSNGDPVTADDFVYSFRRLVDPKTASPYASYLSSARVLNAQDIIDGKKKPETLGIKALDNKTVQISLNAPVPYFADLLIHTSVKPVHRATIERFGTKWTLPENFVGNGAYKLAQWRVNDQIVLERNPLYFDNEHTTVNKITFLAINDPRAELNRYRADELHVAGPLPGKNGFAAAKREFGDQLAVAPRLCAARYSLNTRKAPLNDVRVRRALSYTFDREAIAEELLGRGEAPAYQFTPYATQKMKNNTPEWQTWSKEKRIEEARKLLVEAGYNSENPLKLELLYPTAELGKAMAAATAGFWKAALGNVEVTLNNQEWKNFLETQRQGKFDLSWGGWCADYNEPSSFLNIMKTGDSNNNAGYSNPVYDKLLDKTLDGNLNDEARAELYRQAEAILDRDTPSINIYHFVSAGMVKPYIQGRSRLDPQGLFQVKYWSVLEH